MTCKQSRVLRLPTGVSWPFMDCQCPTAKIKPKQPTLLESAVEAVLLLAIVAVIAIVPWLVCAWLAHNCPAVAGQRDTRGTSGRDRAPLVACQGVIPLCLDPLEVQELCKYGYSRPVSPF